VTFSSNTDSNTQIDPALRPKVRVVENVEASLLRFHLEQLVIDQRLIPLPEDEGAVPGPAPAAAS